MTALVLAQSPDIFSANDFEEAMDSSSPHGSEVDADESMDTTSSRASSPLPPLEDDDKNQTQDAVTPADAFDRMLDEDLENLEEDEKKEEHPVERDEIAPLKSEEVSHGGISNLMNTCYMASALQMLASLESFVQILREQTPKEDSPLYRALLNLWDRLERGETVKPEEVKRLIDERSCLFEGYDQQDSHEFLTTLLDLLDEDYKGKDPPAHPANAGAPATTAKSPTEADDADMEIDENQTPSCKRMKTCPLEEEETEAAPVLETESTHSHASGTYSELDVHQIEALLHGNMATSREGMIIPAPHTPMSCRLVGGRMNPAENCSLWSPNQAPPALETTRTSREETARAEQSNSIAQPNVVQAAAVAPNTETETKPVSRNSPIDDCFATKVRVRLTCDSCKYTRTKDETYLHWSLEMSGDTSADECLRRFFASEKREVKCEKCFGESATQTSHITKLPKMLLLHFKRFVVKVSEDYSSISYEKNSSSVAFDPVISAHDDLQDYTAVSVPGSHYQLRSVVNHHGSSVNFGHYTADAKRTAKQDGCREWHRFNDSFVSKISEQQAVQESSKSAYLVMYELE